MSGQSGGYRLHLSTLNDQLTCKLCGGYFIDATTIVECLHSFCRSCVVKYLESNKYCPICEVQVHKSKPLLNIRPDRTLQDIVYKLVPGCYQNEMRRRREFYNKYPQARSRTSSPESRGEPIESHIYSSDEALSLSLEYYIPNLKDQAESDRESAAKSLPRRYLRCPAAVTVFHLQKLIRAKYGLSDAHRVDVMYKEEPLCGNYTLMDVMYIYHWRRKVPLHLSYRIFESSPKRIKLSEDHRAYEQALSDTRVDSDELKCEPHEKREWKEVQLKISETGVMSVTDISTFEKKNVTNGDGNSENLAAVDDGTSDRVEKVDKVEKRNKNEAAKETKKETLEKPGGRAVRNTDAPKVAKSLSLEQEVRKAAGKTEENPIAGSSESRKTNPVSTASVDSPKAVTRSDTENENLGGCAQKLSSRNKLKNNSTQESQAKNRQDCSSARKLDEKSVNANNNFISVTGKAENRKENSKCSGKEVRNASTCVEPKQNIQNTMVSFQPKVGQVNNTYSKKIPKEKKPATVGSAKLESKAASDQFKLDVRPLAQLAGTKPQEPQVAASTEPASSVATPPPVTIVSDQTVNTFAGASQTGCSLFATPPKTSCISSISTAVSGVQNSPPPNKVVPSSPQSADCQVVKVSDQRAGPAVSAKPGSGARKLSLVKNTNDNPSCSTQSSASAGSNASTTMPGATETNTGQNIAVQNLAGASQAKNKDFENENIGSRSEKQESSTPDAQSLNIYSAATAAIVGPRFITPQTTDVSKRTNSQCGHEITSAYSAPPCPDAIPISLMKPTVRKHEIIAKGTNLNEICAKIGESSKEKIKAATRSKSEIPNLLKITKKTVTDSNKCITGVSNIPAQPCGNNANSVEVKSNICTPKDAAKADTTIGTVHSVPLQKGCFAKKQSQPVGYKTLRDPPKSWNPTLSKNNYVAARNHAKEMQSQTQSSSSSGGGDVKPIHSKPAKIFKMRNVPRYLGNPASGVKPMYGVSTDGKDKDSTAQNVQKNSPLGMMTIDPKTLSPIVSTSNSAIIPPPPPYSPNTRNYQNSQFPREICPHPGSPISPRNSPINMLSTNPFIPSPTLNTNPRLIYTPYPPPFPDTSCFPNPLIRSPIGIPSPSAFHSSLPASINKYQRANYHIPVTGYAPPTPPAPAIQKIIPSMHPSPKSPKSSTTINTGPMFTLNKMEPQLSTRVENIALHLAKNVAKQELGIFNLSKMGNPATTNFQNLATATTVTLSTSAYRSSETPQNASTQTTTTTTTTTIRSKPQSEINAPEADTVPRPKPGESETVRPETTDNKPLTWKAKISEGRADPKPDKDVDKNDKNEKTAAKINGETAAQITAAESTGVESDKDAPATKTGTSPVTTETETIPKEITGKGEEPVGIDSDKVPSEAKIEEAVCKAADQIQGKKSDVQRNKPES